ncbi:PREDICTED: vasopressin V2 receptor [Pseudopodoces humilis]|uniref:vasopressin V2 receptor n=1 Tax=Pseudopodoces humilis TaxID=181119 RepID=UPI0003956DC0|nr:PREDICTED: vasopressin V2 receptor [Pseudopodoces humilis]
MEAVPQPPQSPEPPRGTPVPPRDAALAVAEVAVLALLLALALAGNVLVLLALRAPRGVPRGPGQPPARPARPLRRYLRHLSLADLAAAAGQVLPQLLWDLTDRFRGPDPLCRLTKYLQGVAMFASAYVAVAMAWDRHRAICHPLGTPGTRGARWDALATAWALALLFGLPQVGIFGQREVAPGESDCWATFAQPWGARAYVTWVAVAVLVAPAALLALLQAAVTRELRQRRRGLRRARAKSHRMALVVLGVFVLCWAPFFCAQLWAVWDPRAPREGPAFTILMLLASLTSCTNPWISAAFSTSLARAMARVLCPCRHPRGDTG